MSSEPGRSLHLHTLETLCSDLIAGVKVGLDSPEGDFSLKLEPARRILCWYWKNRQKWSSNVQTADVEVIVDAANQTTPFQPPASPTSSASNSRRFTLVSIQAHQFAGLHHAGTSTRKPDDLFFDFEPKLTLFEGFNGCGKTSLLNAIIWCLTGEVLRPQRPPEVGNKDFTFQVDGASDHSAPPVVPLPDPSLESLLTPAVAVDTWVELKFEDQHGKLYKVRRTLSRGARAALRDSAPELDDLGLDPIGIRVGTTMPGLLPYIQVGSTSSLGKAVSELTGLFPLTQLTSHAERVIKRIKTELKKVKTEAIESLDSGYGRTQADLNALVVKHELDLGGHEIPAPSSSTEVETELSELSNRLSKLRNDGLNNAKLVLGEEFDANNEISRADLLDNLAPALESVKRLENLPSMQRLASLTKLSSEECAPVVAFLEKVRKEATGLKEIAAEPGKAARVRLYTRVAEWIKEHPKLAGDDNSCAICGSSLVDVLDPITGLTVKEHLAGAAKVADFAARTFATWAKHVTGELHELLPAAISNEVRRPAQASPIDLLRTALVDELFEDQAFAKSLSSLREHVIAACDVELTHLPPFEIDSSHWLDIERNEFAQLNRLIARINQALAFQPWRTSASEQVSQFMRRVVFSQPKPGQEHEPTSLRGLLQKLQEVVNAIEPVDDALEKQQRLVDDIKKRRTHERRLLAYDVALEGLNECLPLGALAERQVSQLQSRLHKSASTWRSRVYKGAFPSTSMDLVSSSLSGDGQLQLLVGASGVAAPAQHVANASALRANLLAFYLAYWEYMLRERGGLRLLLLDDPQELLDGDNRNKLADATYDLVRAGAQLILTTHDTRFATEVVARARSKEVGLNHRLVHPATLHRGTIFLTPSIAKVQQAFEATKANPDDPDLAQSYASECRLYLEGRMGDFFDGGAHPAATAINLAPTLLDHVNRLRTLVKEAPNELFRSPVITKFIKDPAFNDGSAVLALLNKAHHRDKSALRPADVAAARPDIERLRDSVERAHQEFRTFNRREPLAPPPEATRALDPALVPSFRIRIQPNLRAFVRDAAFGDSQETEFEEFTSDWFDSKAFFYLRSNTLGFAGPQTSVAIVDVDAVAATDRQLVVARVGKETYARRLLRPRMSSYVALAAEAPDPRNSPPTELLPEAQVALHPIVGMLFGVPMAVPDSKKEAVQVDDAPQLQRVRSAYRIKEESAIPLALPGQIALGGATISLDSLDAHLERYVALHLDDGSSIFKRVGSRLPPPLQHLRQFESIGGLGVADVLAIDREHQGLRRVLHAVSIIGVLYH